VYLKYENPYWFDQNEQKYFVIKNDIKIVGFRMKLLNPMAYLLYLHKEDDYAFHNIDLGSLQGVFSKIYEAYERKIGQRVETEFFWEEGTLIAKKVELENEINFDFEKKTTKKTKKNTGV